MSRPTPERPGAPGTGASLDQWLHYLEAIHPTEIDLGLDRVLLVLRKLFRGKPDARVITVGGTNGKGSTVAALEALLLASGETVGCYTSPHLERYNERVRINGTEVDDAVLVEAFERIEAARDRTSLTYFEFGTLASFLVMAKAGVDYWVLEVGLGGRLDAVNVLDADLAIITSVDLDHTAWLGNDRNTIGFEKAGIFRQGQIAIFADLDPPPSVLQQAMAQKVTLYRPGAGYQLIESDNRVRLVCEQPPLSLSLPTDRLPVTSLAAAAMAARLLALPLSEEGIARVLSGASVPGRYEQLRAGPLVVADVGHNPHAARWLASRLALTQDQSARGDDSPGQSRTLAVYAGLEDKDSAAVAAALRDQVDHWFLAGLQVPRGLSADALLQRLTPVLVPVAGPAEDSLPVTACETVADALTMALDRATAQDRVLVFGSFFTVAAARRYFGSC